MGECIHRNVYLQKYHRNLPLPDACVLNDLAFVNSLRSPPSPASLSIATTTSCSQDAYSPSGPCFLALDLPVSGTRPRSCVFRALGLAPVLPTAAKFVAVPLVDGLAERSSRPPTQDVHRDDWGGFPRRIWFRTSARPWAGARASGGMP